MKKNTFKFIFILLFALSLIALTGCRKKPSVTTEKKTAPTTTIQEDTTNTNKTTEGSKTTEAPSTTTEVPGTTTEAPSSTTEAPDTTTKEPTTTEKAISGVELYLYGKLFSYEDNSSITIEYGDSLDLENIISMKATFSDGSKENIDYDDLEVNGTPRTLNVGEYRISVVYKKFQPTTIVLTVNKKTVDMANVSWNYTEEFVYNGESHTVSLNNLPSLVTATYENNEKLHAGEYEATVSFTYNTDNYELVNNNVSSLSWKIAKAQETITNVSDISKYYDNKPVSGLTFDTLSDSDYSLLFKEKDAEDSEYSNVAPKEIGEYTLKIIVNGNDDYLEASLEKDFEILFPYVESISLDPESIYIFEASAMDPNIGDYGVMVLRVNDAYKNNNLYYYSDEDPTLRNLTCDFFNENSDAFYDYIYYILIGTDIDDDDSYIDPYYFDDCQYISKYIFIYKDGEFVHATVEELFYNPIPLYQLEGDVYVPLQNTTDCIFIDIEWSYYINEELTPSYITVTEKEMDPFTNNVLGIGLIDGEDTMYILDNAEMTGKRTITYGGKTIEYTFMISIEGLPISSSEDGYEPMNIFNDENIYHDSYKSKIYLQADAQVGDKLLELFPLTYFDELDNELPYASYFITKDSDGNYIPYGTYSWDPIYDEDTTVGPLSGYAFGNIFYIIFTPSAEGSTPVRIPIYIYVSPKTYDKEVDWPDDIQIEYGKTYGSFDLSSYSTQDGYFEFEYSENVVTKIGSNIAWMRFVPYDENYDYLEKQITFECIKATPEIDFKEFFAQIGVSYSSLVFPASSVYNGTFSFDNSSSESLHADDSTTLIKEGENKILINFFPAESDKYIPTTLEIIVTGKELDTYNLYEEVTGLTGVYYQTLEGITLPTISYGSYSWKNKDERIETIGNKTYKAILTITDYELLQSYKSTVEVDITITGTISTSEIETLPSLSSSCVIGVAIGEQELTGGKVIGKYGEEIEGTWALADEESIVNVNPGIEVVFTPNDLTKYPTVTGYITEDSNIVSVKSIENDINNEMVVGFGTTNSETALIKGNVVITLENDVNFTVSIFDKNVSIEAFSDGTYKVNYLGAESTFEGAFIYGNSNTLSTGINSYAVFTKDTTVTSFPAATNNLDHIYIASGVTVTFVKPTSGVAFLSSSKGRVFLYNYGTIEGDGIYTSVLFEIYNYGTINKLGHIGYGSVAGNSYIYNFGHFETDGIKTGVDNKVEIYNEGELEITDFTKNGRSGENTYIASFTNMGSVLFTDMNTIFDTERYTNTGTISYDILYYMYTKVADIFTNAAPGSTITINKSVKMAGNATLASGVTLVIAYSNPDHPDYGLNPDKYTITLSYVDSTHYAKVIFNEGANVFDTTKLIVTDASLQILGLE